jgi:hypothetical protein
MAEVGEEDEAHHSSGRVSSNSEAAGWQGHDGDLFSDGKTDSDKSDSYQLLLEEERNGRRKSAGVPVSVEVNVSVDGVENASYPMQSLPLEKVSEGQVVGRQDEAEKGYSLQALDGLDKRETVEVRRFVVGVGPEVAQLAGEDGDVSCWGEKRVESTDQVGEGGTNSGNIVVDLEDAGLGLPSCEEAQVGIHVEASREEEEVGVRELGGTHGVVVVSDVSESTQDSSKGVSNLNKNKNKKFPSKKTMNNSRPPIPPIGTPKFRQIAMALESSGRRRKDGRPSNLNTPSQASILSTPEVHTDSQRPPQYTDFNIEVVLPFHGSDINDLVDDDGLVVPDSISATEETRFQQEEEAAILMGIQKEVGFTFEVEDAEIQSKLVELERSDRAQNIQREQGRGYQ